MSEITLMHVRSERIGYGRLGVYLASELERMGVTVHDAIPDDPRRSVGDGDRIGLSNVACWVSTPSHARGWKQGQIPVIFTMYEAMELPPSFTENLHEFDTVIVPSMQNVELFSAFHDNVRFLPLGIDPETWHYTPRQSGRDFNFLIGGSGVRKGVDLAISAFLEVFGDDDRLGDGPIPQLILKSPRGQNDRCIDARVNHPRITVVPGYLSPEDEVALYESAHCYLQPSRGEGFGLQPLQAIAQGIPTILTAAHGHDSFAHLGFGLDSTPTKAAYFMFGESGDWWEPNYEQLCTHMRFIYDNYAVCLDLAAEAAAVVAREFTWQRVAERFVDIIGADRLGSYQGNGEWHVPASKLYEVICDRDRLIDVAGVRRFYRKGQTYWEPADVKRILFEGDCLDPACLKGEDVGLHPDQLGRVEEYSAAASVCPLCSQPVNAHPTFATAAS